MTEKKAVSMALSLHEPDFESIKQSCVKELRRPSAVKKLLPAAAVLILAVAVMLVLQKLPHRTPGAAPDGSTASDPPSAAAEYEPLHYAGNRVITSLWDAIDFQGGGGSVDLAILSLKTDTNNGVLLDVFTDISETKTVPVLFIEGKECRAPNIPAVPYDDALAAARDKVGDLPLAGCYINRFQSADGVLDFPFYNFIFFVGDPADDVTCWVQIPAYDLSDYYGVEFPLIDPVEYAGCELPFAGGEGYLVCRTFGDDSFRLLVSADRYRLELNAPPEAGGMYTAITKLIPVEGALRFNEADGCYYTDEGVRFLFEGWNQIYILPFADSAAAFFFSSD